MTTDLKSKTVEEFETEDSIISLGALKGLVEERNELARRLEEAQPLLNKIYDSFSIGNQVRTASTLLTNLDNVIRRSRCLSSIEAHHTSTAVDDDGEEFEDSQLNWGENPDEYISTYKAVLAAIKAEAKAEALEELLYDPCLDCIDVEARVHLEKKAAEYRAKAGRKE